MHVAETSFEIENSLRRFGVNDLTLLDRMGLVGPDLLAVHCVCLDDQDVETLKLRGAGVSHNPTSNMYLSSGIAPVPAMLRGGVAVGLASDGPASNNTHNIVQSLKFASLLHKVVSRDPTVINYAKSLSKVRHDRGHPRHLGAGDLRPAAVAQHRRPGGPCVPRRIIGFQGCQDGAAAGVLVAAHGVENAIDRGQAEDPPRCGHRRFRRPGVAGRVVRVDRRQVARAVVIAADGVEDTIDRASRYFANCSWQSSAVLPTAHSGAGALHVAERLRNDGRLPG